MRTENIIHIIGVIAMLSMAPIAYFSFQKTANDFKLITEKIDFGQVLEVKAIDNSRMEVKTDKGTLIFHGSAAITNGESVEIYTSQGGWRYVKFENSPKTFKMF